MKPRNGAFFIYNVKKLENLRSAVIFVKNQLHNIMSSIGINKRKQYQYILQVYNEYKQPDIPDTFIIHKIFPKHHIYISYRQWARIKGVKPSEITTEQLSLF